jgi:hypothetical protein
MIISENKLYEIKHPYYCSDNNYFSRECTWEYGCWDDFYEEHHDDDIDMNLIFRWDWDEHEVSDDEQSTENILQLSVIRQRKGIFGVYLIAVNKEDEPKIKEFLKPHADYMKQLWRGFDDNQ